MNDAMKFRRVGGSRQMVLANAEDMKQIVNLDTALWAVNSMPLESVIADPEFLEFLDTDHNKRIRPDELRSAVSWILDILSDYSGLDAGSDTLRIDAISPLHKDAPLLKASARLVLQNLNAENQEVLTLSQIRDKKNIIAAGNSNGDGIITPNNTNDEMVGQMINDIIACSGSKVDRSGGPGIDAEILDAFLKEAAAHLDWLKTGLNDDKTSPYGEKVSAFYGLFDSIRAKMDEFYSFCGGLADDDEGRFGSSLKVDPLNVPEMTKFIQTAPAAIPNKKSVLDSSKWLNPLWKGKILEFLAMAKELGAIAKSGIITEAEWGKIHANFEVRTAWSARKKNDKFDILSLEKIEEYLKEENVAKLRKMMVDDLSVAGEIDALDNLRKLILYQKNMLEFLNNYITLESLFNPERPSMVQPGALIMDGRYFTLASYVFNIAEHKKIISRSNICVVYLELTTGTPPALRKMTIAVAITSGSMRNIFIGRSAIFITGDGTEWDAKVIDLIQQPVSFKEALLMPFYKIGDFAGKQADKFFSARSKEAETALTKQADNITSGKVPQTQVQQTAAKQTPAVSGSMLLMGGGVGIAALGSSIAFITNSLKNIPLWHVLAVFFGIVLIISAPMMFVSLVKLWSRCISDFFAASGWALNPKMRLSRKMGSIFTYKPRIPNGIMLRGDVVKIFASFRQDEKKCSFCSVLAYLLAVIIGAAAAYFFFTWYTGIRFF